jgi:(2Fe-2S) ferredoxin
MAKRKHYLFVCVNRREDGAPRGSCAGRGAVEIHGELKRQLKDGGLAEVEARACTASCLDVCWVGPTIFVEPDGFAYGRVKSEDVPEIVQALRDGHRVERLVLDESEYLEPKARES